VALAVWFALAIGAHAALRQTIYGQAPQAASLQPLQRLQTTKTLDLVLALPLRNQQALTNFLKELYEPASPSFHRFLTADQFTVRFGPSETDYQALVDFVQANGLKVTDTHSNRTLIDVSGSVADIERMFQVRLQVYQHPFEARTFYAPDSSPSLEFPVPVLSVSGLDDFFPPRPMNLRDFRSNSLTVKSYVGGSGPRGNLIGRDFRAAYAPGVGLDGAGQSAGLLELDGYYAGDIQTYARLAGLPYVPLTNVLLNGVTGIPGAQNIEAALDIDMVMSMAPGLARVIVYEGRSGNDLLNRMATDNQAKQLSSSWGFGSAVDPARDQIFQQFAAQGQSFFQASGDNGAWTGAIFPPSDNPYITVVGGTDLTTVTNTGAWVSESAWPFGGGGSSTVYSIPAWQQGVSTITNQGSSSMRNIPDVAAVADNIWLVANNGEQGVIDGTSASAPLWAGLAALANQQAALRNQPPVGFINPALYSIGKSSSYLSSFHDITTGNNTNDVSNNKFLAVAGYDLCTGWGTPGGSNLLTALLMPPKSLRITPASDFVFSGPFGGPFTPGTQVYSLTNDTSASLNWSASSSTPWFSVSPTIGTLAVGGPPADVTVAPTAVGSNQSPGSYTATLLFTNLTDQTVQARTLTLDVVTPLVITSQPTNQALLEGMSAIFTFGVSNPASAFYQWRFDNGVSVTNLSDNDGIAGARTASLTLSNVSPSNAGSYSVIASNAAGTALSSSALLSIMSSRPVITAQPADQTALPGQTVVLAVTAFGTQPLSYQWQQNGTNLVDGGGITGYISNHFLIANVSAANAGTYSVVASNGLGQAPSTGAVISVVSVTAPEITMATLHSLIDGHPNGLVQWGSNVFYGTTQNGGSNSSGTIFQWTPGTAPSVFHSFTGRDGATPFSTLLPHTNGNLYGTTFQGGELDNGALFGVRPGVLFTNIVSFNITNGSLPYAGLTLEPNGNLYGVTWQGGAFGRGTAFKLTTIGQQTLLYSFSNGADGGHPSGDLCLGSDANFYGTTYRGGASDCGTVFRLGVNGMFASLMSFNATNGAFPRAGLVQGTDGNFYGATWQGGGFGYGTIFKISSSGLLTSIYSFNGGSDGANPGASLLEGSDGNLYATTAFGGAYGQGTIFRLTPAGAVSTIATFEGYNGANPQTKLTEGADGNLYGTTQNGGANGQGTIFRLSVVSSPQITSQPVSQSVYEGADVAFSVAVIASPPIYYQWRRDGTNLGNFGHVSGATARVLRLSAVTPADIGNYSVVVSNTLGSVASSNAVLQVAVSGPTIVTQPTSQTVAPGATVAFSVTAAGNLPLTYRWQKDGTALSDGGNLFGSGTSTLTLTNVTEANNGSYAIVVTNVLGSITSTPATLSVIPVTVAGTRLTTLHWFTGGNEGGNPNQLVQATNGFLYGTTKSGGIYGLGAAFGLSTNGALSTLFSFDGTNGGTPLAPLLQATDGFLYGTSAQGGRSNAGTLFRMTLAGVPSNLHMFAGPEGANPWAGVAQGAEGNLYGAARNGGGSGFGSLFKATSNGMLDTLYSFGHGSDGGFPVAALARGADGNFYGVTETGGSYGKGNIFKVTPAGEFTLLYSFSGGTDGYSPAGALVPASDGNFYGATKHSTLMGFEFYGTFFRVTPAGALSTLYTLNGATGDGFYPYAGLVEADDGNFYGTTHDGGANGKGILFRLTPAGAFTVLLSFDGFAIGANPESALIEGADGSLYGTTTTGGPGGAGTIFRLAFTSAPQILTQPAGITVLVGSAVQFRVSVSGAPPLSFAWKKNGTNMVDGGNVFGASTRILTLTNVSFADNGTYSVLVTNFMGTVTSSGALLRVVTAPVFQSIRTANNTVTLAWSAIAGQRYRLQYKPNLSSGTWLNLGNIVTATTNSVIGTDTIAANTQRFYRVLMLP
jgi:uncharacterized repeat protein (TIGR03803 family)